VDRVALRPGLPVKQALYGLKFINELFAHPGLATPQGACFAGIVCRSATNSTILQFPVF